MFYAISEVDLDQQKRTIAATMQYLTNIFVDMPLACTTVHSRAVR